MISSIQESTISYSIINTLDKITFFICVCIGIADSDSLLFAECREKILHTYATLLNVIYNRSAKKLKIYDVFEIEFVYSAIKFVKNLFKNRETKLFF